MFNKGLKKDEKSEGLLKILTNIEDKTDNNLRAIEGPKKEESDPRISFNNFRQQLTREGIDIFDRIVNERNQFNYYMENNFRGDNNQQYNFSAYFRIGDLFNRIYNGKLMIPEAEREQEALDYYYARLERYRPRPNSNYCLMKDSVKNNIEHLKNGRKLTINAFKNRIFPLRDSRFYPQYREDESNSSDDDDDDNDDDDDDDDEGSSENNNSSG